MILVIGGTGHLGTAAVHRLVKSGRHVRLLTRKPGNSDLLEQQGVEIFEGDLRDPVSLKRACKGVDQVLAAAHALNGKGDNNPHTVDDQGNRGLIDAAREAGVKQFIFVSVINASPDSPLEFFRIKYRVEEYLRSSGMPYTILRPAAFMDLWGQMIGKPLLKQGKASVFGSGSNPINFVAVEDVADMICAVLENPKAIGKIIPVGGPENLTMEQIVDIFESVAGHPMKKSHVPLSILRAMSVLMRPINPTASRLIQMGVHMDIDNLKYEITGIQQEFALPKSRFEDWTRSFYETRR